MREYYSSKKQGMPSALLYLCLPIVLTTPIRNNLPKSISTNILSWVNNNKSLLIDFPDTVNCFFEISQSAIDFIYEQDLIYINDHAEIIPNTDIKITANPSFFKRSISMSSHLRNSSFIGRWLATSPDTKTIYSTFGIRP
ncbi:three component ABC system middle component [Photobacterium leiognathi]|uniref:three component ABC system middle component n=1 Tax=Photobacterium leiognathi TaxID=553611 RepID=UPI0030C7F6C7